jgi:hypothetical protein
VTVVQDLLELERGFWLEGADFYRQHLAEDFLMLFPGIGALGRAQTIEGVEGGERWDQLETRDERVLDLGPDARVLSYEAQARRHGQEEYTALVGSVYVRRDGVWKLGSRGGSYRTWGAAATTSVLAPVVERFTRTGRAVASPRRALVGGAAGPAPAFYGEWRDRLADAGFRRAGRGGPDRLGAPGQRAAAPAPRAGAGGGLFEEMRPLVPFARDLMALHEARRRIEPVDAAGRGGAAAALPDRVAAARAEVEAALAAGRRVAGAQSARRRGRGAAGGGRRGVAPPDAGLLARPLRGLRPLFTWWVAEPYERAREALEGTSRSCGSRWWGSGRAGPGAAPIVGEPIGADGMRADLRTR